MNTARDTEILRWSRKFSVGEQLMTGDEGLVWLQHPSPQMSPP